MTASLRSSLSSLLLLSAAFVSGCAFGPAAANNAGTAPTEVSGSVFGGQAPINLAHVYLFAANTSGYGSAAVPLLTQGDGSDTLGYYVLTNTRGFFRLTGKYTCTQGQQVYLLALGGDAGSGTNSAAAELAVLGTCPSGGALSSSLFIQINELTTVAAAYALSGYITDITHVSAPTTTQATVGITNAFNNAANLVALGTGSPMSTPLSGNGSVPAAEINTLGNIAAACINSSGPSGSSTNPNSCDTLFASTRQGGVAPSTSADALINIAHNPAANVATLFNLPTPAAPFSPTLSRAPNDWTVGITFTGGHLSAPSALAVTSTGSLFVTDNANGLLLYSPLGAELSAATGDCVTHANALAVDSMDAVWVADAADNCLAQYSSTGAPLVVASSVTGLNSPQSVAIDPSGALWVSNRGANSLSVLNSAGAHLYDYTSYLNAPTYVGIDGRGYLSALNADNSITRVNTAGAYYQGNDGGGGLNGAAGLALDSGNNRWLPNTFGGSISEFSAAGVALTGTSGYTAACLTAPAAVAIDGAGNVWAPNGAGTSRVCELSNAGATLTGSNGFVSAGMAHPGPVAIDPSGNVWMLNTTSGSMVELVGAAVPVVTPLSAGTKNNTVATRP